jgi:hypothetical protein
MVYGNRDLVRRLMGNPDTSDVSDNDIDTFLSYGTASVQAETAKSDWQSTDLAWAMVNEATNYFASSRGREMFSDKDKVSDNHYQRALDICQRIVASAGLNEGGVIIRSSSYKTYPMNPDGEIYRSGRATGSFGVGDTSEFIP